MPVAFNTYNQFDKRFIGYGNFDNDRNACPIFSLVTVRNFMELGEIGQKDHEDNLTISVINYLTNDGLPKYFAFDELLQLTDGTYSYGDILATTPEMIGSGDVSYPHMFDQNRKGNYGVIFLKNGNFFTVLVKQDDEKVPRMFALRDCHEVEQYNFDNLGDLMGHLQNKYQFEEMTIVGGVVIEEYGNIEFLVVDKPFETLFIDMNKQGDNEVPHSDQNGWENDSMYVHQGDQTDDFFGEDLYSNDAADDYDPTAFVFDEQIVVDGQEKEQKEEDNDIDLDMLLAMQLQFGD